MPTMTVGELREKLGAFDAALPVEFHVGSVWADIDRIVVVLDGKNATVTIEGVEQGPDDKCDKCGAPSNALAYVNRDGFDFLCPACREDRENIQRLGTMYAERVVREAAVESALKRGDAVRCRWCEQRLTNEDGVLVDETGGDVCGTREAQDDTQDDTVTGTNPSHEIDVCRICQEPFTEERPRRAQQLGVSGYECGVCFETPEDE